MMYGKNIWEDLKWRYKYGSPLLKVIFIIIASFILVETLGFIDFIANTSIESFILKHFALHTSFNILLTHPWSFITYAFIHDSFWHIFWNLGILYLFGNIIEDLLGKPKVIPIFFFGIFFGGLLYIACYNIIPALKTVSGLAFCVGCSAGVMAMLIAATTLSPNYQIGIFLIGPVRIIWIAIICVFLDFVDMRRDGNIGGHIAHLGGALFGFAYIKMLQSGYDLSNPFYAVIDFFSNLFKKKSKLKVEYKKEYAYTSSNKQTKTNTAQQGETISKQEKLDAILDKINRSSYDSLSKEEKDFLFKISQE